MKIKSRLPILVSYAAIIWIIVVLLVVPNINAVLAVFWRDGSFTAEPFTRLLQSTRAMNSLRNSFILAPILSITVGFVGISIVLITEYFDIKFAKILRLGYMTTLIYGGIILVSGYRFLYGHNGYFTNFLVMIFPNFNTRWFEGFWAVLFVMTFANTGFHMIFLRNAMRSVDFQTVEAAQNMGAKPLYILRRIVLPVLTPSLLVVTVLTFLAGLAATSAPLLVGGVHFQTINPMILSLSRLSGSRDIAVLLALILGSASILLIAVLTHLERRGHYLSVSKVKTTVVKQKIRNPIVNALVHSYAYVLFVIYVAPVVFVILFSFTDAATIARRQLTFDSFTLQNYVNTFTTPSSYRPIGNSVVFSFFASVGVMILALVSCRMLTKLKNKVNSVVEYALMIPWLLPNVLIALGLITTFNQPRWYMFNQVLTGTMGIMIIGYIIIRIPFTFRITRASFYSLDGNLEDAAKNLGAGIFYTFFMVVLPVILPSVLAVLALNFNWLLQEFEMSIFMFHPLRVPMGVQIQNLTLEDHASIDNIAVTFVYAVLIMIVSGVTLYLVYGRGRKISE